MSDYWVDYELPVSALRFAGTRTEMTDAVLKSTDVLRSGTVELDVVGGDVSRRLTLNDGFLSDTKASFTKTDDGRLSGLDVTATGQAGKVLLGVTAVAANLVGLFAGFPPGALAAVKDKEGTSKELTPEERVAKAYIDVSKANAELATVRSQYEQLVSDAVKEIAEQSLLLLKTQPAAERAAILSQLRIIEQQLPVWRTELDRLNAHFAAWRAGTLDQHVTQHAEVFTLDRLRAADISVGADEKPSFGDHADGERAHQIWERFGLLVTMPQLEVKDIPDPREDNRLVVRVPRWTTLSVYERGDDGHARLQRTFHQLVMDDSCPHYEIELKESWFSKRSTKLTFSPLGTLTGITEEAESSAAGFAAALSQLPATVQGGLESAQKTRSAWVGLRDAGLSEELERTKKETELKQKQLESAGLAATEGQYAELERLKQQADILAKQKAIGDAALDPGDRQNALLKQQVDFLKNQKDVSEATRTLQAEQELYNLRLEIERLNAEKELGKQ